MKLELFGHIFGKNSDIKFNQNPCSGSRVVPCGWTGRQTDRHDDAILRSHVKNGAYIGKLSMFKYVFVQ